MKTDEPQEPMEKSFDALLGDLDDGAIVACIDEDLKSLMRQTLAVAKSKGQAGSAAGVLDVKLVFKVDASGEVEIAAKYTTKAPTLPNAVTRRWLDPKTASIVDTNPKQMGLPLRDAPPNSNLRSIDHK